MIGVVVSRADEASEHIGEQLRELADWDHERDGSRPAPAGGGTVLRTDGAALRTVEELHLHLEDVAAAFADPDLVVFASRHSGETGPLLTGHFTGNLGAAEYGGSPRSLARAAPGALAVLYDALAEHAPPGYEVGIECTHHGPSDVGAPSLFAEVGSGPDEWADPRAARAVARAILALRDRDPAGERTVVGLGGGHYAPRFERILRETPWTVGHVAADWALEDLGDPQAATEVLEALFVQSGARHALIDGDHPALAEAIEGRGYRVVSETWLREVGDRPLAVVEDLEERLAPVGDGMRFGTRPATGEVAVVELPSDLLAAAEAVDREATRTAVADRAVALETREDGNRVGDRAAVPQDPGREPIVDALVALLERDYDDVRRGSDAVVVRETAFDPELARDAGVPEGPAFGRLADGEPVEVDGRTVEPDAVTVERERRFEL